MTPDSDLKAWWGPAILGHPWWEGRSFYGAFRFEDKTAAGAIHQATEAYDLVFRAMGISVEVEIARDAREKDMAYAAFIARESDVLKICPV